MTRTPGGSSKLGELLLCSGEADLESLDLAEPAFPLGLGDAAVRLSRISSPPVLWAGSGRRRER